MTVLALCAAGCGQGESSAGTAPPPIEVRGIVHPAQMTTITAQVDGVVEAVGAAEGTRVAAGGLVAQLANAAVERDAEVANAQVALIEARLRRAGEPVRTAPGRPVATSDISAKILELRRDRFETMKALRATNDVTAGDLQQAEVEYLAALRDYTNERRAATGTPAAVADTELMRLERQKLLADQKFAAHRQSLLAVTAPFAGVLMRVYVTAGQAVYPRDPVADVADLSTLQVRAGIAPDLLRFVRPGTRVQVRILSTPVRTFADEIDAIVPARAGATQPALPEIIVTIPNPDASLQPNSEAVITLRPAA